MLQKNAKSAYRNIFCLVFFALVFPAAGIAQPDYQLEFVSAAGDTFSWRSGFGAFMTTAPNGTTAFTGGGEVFLSFEDFQDGVVGQWLVTDFAFNEATFVVSSFQEQLFAQDVELLNPISGQDIISGVPLNYVVVTEKADFVGIGVSFSGDELDIDFEPGQIMILTLLDGVNESFPLVRGRGGDFVSSVVSDIDDAEVSFNISNSIRFIGETEAMKVRVVRQSIVGDVNRDGSVDLLDVAPFVDVLTSGGYQFEADIDGNGVVDLLDVTPFVSLLQ